MVALVGMGCVPNLGAGDPGGDGAITSAARAPEVGDRLLLVMESHGVTGIGGTVSLQLQGGPTLGFTALESPSNLHVARGFSGEAYLLSDPLNEAQLEAGQRINGKSTMAVSMNLIADAGDLTSDAQGRVRAIAATWRTRGESVIVMPYLDLGQPLVMQ
jgi:hypothetical protein